MSRFFQNAAFPILIVIVLAIFVSKLLSSGGSTTPYTWNNMLQDVKSGAVTQIKSDQAGSSVTVTTVNRSRANPDSLDRRPVTVAAERPHQRGGAPTAVSS